MSGVLAPCSGVVLPVTECVDPVFAGQIVGPGVVIDPPDGEATVVSPITGTVVKVHPHAFVVAGGEVAVLVHLGINTVRLEGHGFGVHVEQGASVSAGDPVVTWSPADLPQEVDGQEISRQVPVIVLDVPADSLDLSALPDRVASGDPLCALP